MAALGFYAYFRVRYTLGLGPYTIYGIVVFAIEMLGATASISYGICLVRLPVYEDIKTDEGKVLCQYPYHVRVLVPCYQEPLALIRKTIEAALDAELPKGVNRTIYLCDDGKDPQKRAFCRTLGAEGRFRWAPSLSTFPPACVCDPGHHLARVLKVKGGLITPTGTRPQPVA